MIYSARFRPVNADLRLVDMVDRIKRYSMKHGDNGKKQDCCSYQCLFDLWLLNIADIIVSIDNKYGVQSDWRSKEKADRKIRVTV